MKELLEVAYVYQVHKSGLLRISTSEYGLINWVLGNALEYNLELYRYLVYITLFSGWHINDNFPSLYHFFLIYLYFFLTFEIKYLHNSK